MTRAPAPAAVDAWLNAWIGTPFAWDGRSRAGVDCWGLVWCFYRDLFGVTLPDWRAAGRSARWRSQSFTHGRETLWRGCGGQIEALRPHVALVTRTNVAHHIGIAWRGRIIHAVEGARVEAVSLPHFAALFGTPDLGTIERPRACRAA